MQKKNKPQQKQTPSTQTVQGSPENVWETVNKFGTYNIQDTANTENEFPQIAPGKNKHNNPPDLRK